MDLEMIEFCVRLGNPIPCKSLDVLDKMGQLDYLEANPRATVYLGPHLSMLPKEIIIYFAKKHFILLLDKDKIEFIVGDMFICENPGGRPTIAVPADKHLFEIGNSTEFFKYKLY